MVLIFVLAFNDRYGKTLAQMDKRCLRMTSDKARDKVISALGMSGTTFEVDTSKNGSLFSVKTDAVNIHIRPLGPGSSEIVLERQAGASNALVEAVEAAIVA
jgi:hypothetical protein